jgi:hypothetical protein
MSLVQIAKPLEPAAAPAAKSPALPARQLKPVDREFLPAARWKSW